MPLLENIKAFVEYGMRKSAKHLRRFNNMKTLSILIASLLVSINCYAESGYATYYTVKSCQREGTSGVYTASGERYNEKALTCALRSHKFGHSYVVYSLATGRSVIVRHNDYGPGKKPLKRGVIIDLTPRAFKEVCGDLKQGNCQVSIQEVVT